MGYQLDCERKRGSVYINEPDIHRVYMTVTGFVPRDHATAIQSNSWFQERRRDFKYRVSSPSAPGRAPREISDALIAISDFELKRREKEGEGVLSN